MSLLHEHSLEVKSYSYEWTIDEFSSHSRFENNVHNSIVNNGIREYYVLSPSFPEVPGNAIIPKWCIRAFALNSIYPDHLSLEVVSLSASNTCAKFKLSVLNNKREKLTVAESKTLMFTSDARAQRFDQVLPRKFIMCTANGLLTSNKLRILCEVSAVLESVNVSLETKVLQYQKPEHNLGENFGILFDSKQGSDVTLATGDREFQAHSIVLTARSKVFAAMFKHETEEKKLGRVTISDVDPVVMVEILRYMYTDKVSNLNTMADHRFLAAADKYALENLKVMCEETLWANISIEEAANTLISADRHSAERLKRRTIDFIIIKASYVVETQGWKDMIKSHPYLIAEAFCAIAIGSNYKEVKN